MAIQNSFKVQKTNIYKAVFLLYFLLVYTSITFEIIYLASLLLFIGILFVLKLDRITVDIVALLSLILMTGFISSFGNKIIIFDFIKNILYFTKPILMICIGYFFCKGIKDRQFLFKSIFYLSVLSAIVHIVIVVKWFYIKGVDVNSLRYIGGRSSDLEFFGLLFILSRRRLGLNFLSQRMVKLGFTLLFISFVFYFSRTQFVAFVIFLLAIFGYAKIKDNALMIISFLVLAFIMFFSYLNSIDLDRNSKGIDGFLYKVKVAPSEIFNTDINKKDHAQLWDRWRGYEAKMAIEQVNDKGISAIIIGTGLSSLVDLKIDFFIEGIDDRNIPILHNGFALIYFRAGIVGLILYLLFILRLYVMAYMKISTDVFSSVINNYIAGFGLYLFFTTLIISGIYNVFSTVPLLLGYFLGYSYLSKNALI